jgi:glycine cleavage system H protein
VDVPDDLRYTEDHEWLRIDGTEGVVGITAYAADQLGDIVFVELPQVGAELTARQSLGVIESVKAVSDLYAPVAGEVVATNGDLTEKPELLNSDPYGDGWMVRLRLADAAEAEKLKDAAGYRALTEAG